MSQLILDTSDPAVAEMVAQWEEGGVYSIELNITQGPTKGSLVRFDVNEVTNYGDAEPAAASEEAPIGEDTGGVAGAKPLDRVPITGPGEVE